MKKIFIGLTVLALLALVAGPALACDGDGCRGLIIVKNNKNATVTNVVGVEASTGYNSVIGGSGGDGGVGGEVNIDNDGNDGGNGGNGGTINTGNAKAKSEIKNIVNTDITKIDCGCAENGIIIVKNRDNATVLNGVGVLADTGVNFVSGGSGGSGGVGGRVNINNDNNDGGNGGSGGTITTSDAKAKSKVVNIVNTIITRIR